MAQEKIELEVVTFGADGPKSEIVMIDKPEGYDEEIRFWQENGCNCEDATEVAFADDGECGCGVHKHHYHCKRCDGITQIG